MTKCLNSLFGFVQMRRGGPVLRLCRKHLDKYLDACDGLNKEPVRLCIMSREMERNKTYVEYTHVTRIRYTGFYRDLEWSRDDRRV